MNQTHWSGVTLNGWPEELLGGGEDAGEHEVDGGALVEQLEAPVVDGDLVNFQEVTRDFRHGAYQVCHHWLLLVSILFELE